MRTLTVERKFLATPDLARYLSLAAALLQMSEAEFVRRAITRQINDMQRDKHYARALSVL